MTKIDFVLEDMALPTISAAAAAVLDHPIRTVNERPRARPAPDSGVTGFAVIAALVFGAAACLIQIGHLLVEGENERIEAVQEHYRVRSMLVRSRHPCEDRIEMSVGGAPYESQGLACSSEGLRLVGIHSEADL